MQAGGSLRQHAALLPWWGIPQSREAYDHRLVGTRHVRLGQGQFGLGQVVRVDLFQGLDVRTPQLHLVRQESDRVGA